MMRKMLSTLLAVTMMMSALVVPASAANKVRPSDEFIQSRIDQLSDWLVGSYFNVGQNTACGKKASGHGCKNCNTANIVKQKWFLDHFDNKIQISQFGTGEAKSCVGFGWFAGWYIMRASDTDTVVREKIGEYTSNIKKNILNKAKLGDYLWINGHHAVIYLGDQGNGRMKVLDCNWGTDYNCMVRERTVKYSSLERVRIHRFYSESGNYCQHKGYETLKKSGTYSAFCKSCGEEFEMDGLDASVKGTYVVQPKSVSLCTVPYKQGGVMCVKGGSKVKIVGGVTNAYDNLWLKTDSGYYIYSGHLKKA